MMQRLLPLLIVALVAGGCPRHAPAPDAPVVTVALEGAPATLDPRFALDAYSSRILALACPGLLRIGADGNVEPALARAIEFPDNQTIRLPLRQGLRFHDGQPLDATAAARSLNALRDPAIGSPRAASFDAVSAITVDRDAVLIRLREPFAPILAALTAPLVSPSQATAEHIDVPAGAGPFRLARSQDPDEILALRLDASARNDDVDRIVFRTIADPVARVFALETGAADLAQNSVPAGELDHLRNVPGIRITQQPGWNTSYLGFNVTVSPLDDARVRRAVAAAINRERIIRVILDNTARLNGSLLPPQHWAWADTAPPGYDPALARRWLDAAGHPDPDGDGPAMRFELEYKTSTNPERLRIAEAIAADLAAVGIAVRIRSLEFGTFFDDVRNGRMQMYSLTWVGITEPDLLYYALHSASIPPAGANRGRFRDAETDRLLAAARHTLDRNRRRALYQQAQRRLAWLVPVIPLWTSDTIIVQSERLTPFVPRPDGSYAGLADLRLRGAGS
ncbi:MAG: ABC transporter substrate-binding protein [Candidatus Dadabacteria bacterium]|nr:MAG: ABC transporter substrate-binding protein [Candidatus Dadabacteria bacterium]